MKRAIRRIGLRGLGSCLVRLPREVERDHVTRRHRLATTVDDHLAERRLEPLRASWLLRGRAGDEATEKPARTIDTEEARRELHDIAMLSGTCESTETAAFRAALEAFERVAGRPLFVDDAAEDQAPK